MSNNNPSQRQPAAIPSTAKKGRCLVRCSTHRHLAHELLIRFVNDRAIIGAKRPVEMDFQGGGVAQQNSTNALSGKFELINGVTWQCLHCTHPSMFMCGHCKLWSCDKDEDIHTCPQCGRKTSPDQKKPVERINATEKKKGHTAIEGPGSTALRLTHRR